MADDVPCIWCQAPIHPRADGGKPQRFCCERHRRAYDAAGRGWVARAIEGGRLSVDELVIAAAARRAVHHGAMKLPALTNVDFEREARRSGEAEDLINAILIAMAELDEADFTQVLELFPAGLTRRLFEWADGE
jgi:hypothetical protein